MASQRRFEGGELEELLERVRAEVGPDARIVAANRIRQGGVAGFFAKQAFEVVVEPAESGGFADAASDATSIPAPAAPPLSQPAPGASPCRPFRLAPRPRPRLARAEGRAPRRSSSSPTR